jgi:hypothetical protein
MRTIKKFGPENPLRTTDLDISKYFVLNEMSPLRDLWEKTKNPTFSAMRRFSR